MLIGRGGREIKIKKRGRLASKTEGSNNINCSRSRAGQKKVE